MEREGEGPLKDRSEQCVGRGSSTTSTRCEGAEGRSASARREMHCMGIDVPPIAFKMEIGHRLIVHFIRVLRE